MKARREVTAHGTGDFCVASELFAGHVLSAPKRIECFRASESTANLDGRDCDGEVARVAQVVRLDPRRHARVR
jgi:hypothetical protein